MHRAPRLALHAAGCRSPLGRHPPAGADPAHRADVDSRWGSGSCIAFVDGAARVPLPRPRRAARRRSATFFYALPSLSLFVILLADRGPDVDDDRDPARPGRAVHPVSGTRWSGLRSVPAEVRESAREHGVDRPADVPSSSGAPARRAGDHRGAAYSPTVLDDLRSAAIAAFLVADGLGKPIFDALEDAGHLQRLRRARSLPSALVVGLALAADGLLLAALQRTARRPGSACPVIAKRLHRRVPVHPEQRVAPLPQGSRDGGARVRRARDRTSALALPARAVARPQAPRPFPRARRECRTSARALPSIVLIGFAILLLPVEPLRGLPGWLARVVIAPSARCSRTRSLAIAGVDAGRGRGRAGDGTDRSRRSSCGSSCRSGLPVIVAGLRIASVFRWIARTAYDRRASSAAAASATSSRTCRPTGDAGRPRGVVLRCGSRPCHRRAARASPTGGLSQDVPHRVGSQEQGGAHRNSSREEDVFRKHTRRAARAAVLRSRLALSRF